MMRMGHDEALALLGSAKLGRIVFTQHALPAIRPVNHILHRGLLILRTHADAALTVQLARAGTEGIVVAYEADVIDPDTHLGWSVIVTGRARLVQDPATLADYEEILEPWIDRTMDRTVTIEPEIVTGLRLTGETRQAGTTEGRPNGTARRP